MSGCAVALHAAGPRASEAGMQGGLTSGANIKRTAIAMAQPSSQSSTSARSRKVFNTVKLFMNPFKEKKEKAYGAGKNRVWTPPVLSRKEKISRCLSRWIPKFKIHSPFPRIEPTAEEFRSVFRTVRDEWRLRKGIEVQHYDQWENITNVRFDANNKKCYVQKQYDGNIVLHLNGNVLCALLQAFQDLFLGLLAVYLSLLRHMLKVIYYVVVVTVMLLVVGLCINTFVQIRAASEYSTPSYPHNPSEFDYRGNYQYR